MDPEKGTLVKGENPWGVLLEVWIDEKWMKIGCAFYGIQSLIVSIGDGHQANIKVFIYPL